MIRRQAFKFKLMPKQERMLRQSAGSCRFVFNKALELQKFRFENNQRKMTYAELCKELTKWRHQAETAFLSEAPAQPLQQSLKDLERGYSNFFAGRARLPRYKKRGVRDSFRYPDSKQIKLDETNSRIFLPKLGWVRYRKSRTIEGSVKQVTVSCNAGNWYVSIQTEKEVDDQAHPANSIVGVDLGIAMLATLSNGATYSPVNSYRRRKQRIARVQRRLARMEKHSANWLKQKKQLQSLYKKTADFRRDHLHKVSTSISKNHAIVVIEDLQVKSMSKSAIGTVEKPGTNVKAKSGLNTSILDQGWYEFRRQLEYKQSWRGGTVVVVPAQYTSQRCSACCSVAAENRISQSLFICLKCGHKENADVNAARNILAAGRAVLARGEKPLGLSMKQEPAVSAAKTKTA